MMQRFINLAAEKGQDAYSMRSTPQVIRAAFDVLEYAGIRLRLNSYGVGDNPIFLPEFKLTPLQAPISKNSVSLPMDIVGAAITMVCVISERRLNRLTDPALSVNTCISNKRSWYVLWDDAWQYTAIHSS
jgi:histidine ammonia-lyase